MAGQDPNGGFERDQFEFDIRSVMTMGMPNVVEDRPTFHFAETRVFASHDIEGSPFDWETQRVDALPGEEPREPTSVLCAVESIGQGEASEGTDIGEFDMNRARLYILDDEWALIDDFTSVWLSGSEYIRVKQLPILALFDVDVHVVEIRARDES